ncbi:MULTISPECIES: hypothetical protein [Streptomyces]|uniref:hypothetical protein n=1 Tax=Streptomyces TaxID=1883 RepID=UPI0019C6DAE0|nr:MULTISPECIES: hypothetical protein [Streptomyces]GGR59546.1 hypothetical protein GCM10010236_10290 [Streptomyces eurythermus]
MTMAADGKTTTYIGDPAGNLVTSVMPTTETENRTYRAGRITAVTAPNTESVIRADAQLDRVAQTAASHDCSAADINQIYSHLFVESHQLDAGMLRFDANPRIARAWNASRMENRIPAVLTCSRMNCTSRTGCVSTATRTTAVPVR